MNLRRQNSPHTDPLETKHQGWVISRSHRGWEVVVGVLYINAVPETPGPGGGPMPDGPSQSVVPRDQEGFGESQCRS